MGDGFQQNQLSHGPITLPQLLGVPHRRHSALFAWQTSKKQPHRVEEG
jgi:hypothetical protein